MTRQTESLPVKHLSPDELDLCAAAASDPDYPETLGAHLRTCVACRDDVAFVRALDSRLATLPYAHTSPGFSGRVLARVQLPKPWSERMRAAVRRRWAAAAATTAALAVTVGGMSFWLFGQLGVTPGGLVTFVYEGVQGLMVRGFIAAGRLLYNLGVIDLGSTVLNDIGLAQALMAMAALGLLVVTAFLATIQLVPMQLPRLQSLNRGR
jgi:hypothetical protein